MSSCAAQEWRCSPDSNSQRGHVQSSGQGMVTIGLCPLVRTSGGHAAGQIPRRGTCPVVRAGPGHVRWLVLVAGDMSSGAGQGQGIHWSGVQGRPGPEASQGGEPAWAGKTGEAARFARVSSTPAACMAAGFPATMMPAKLSEPSPRSCSTEPTTAYTGLTPARAKMAAMIFPWPVWESSRPSPTTTELHPASLAVKAQQVQHVVRARRPSGPVACPHAAGEAPAAPVRSTRRGSRP